MLFLVEWRSLVVVVVVRQLAVAENPKAVPQDHVRCGVSGLTRLGSHQPERLRLGDSEGSQVGLSM